MFSYTKRNSFILNLYKQTKKEIGNFIQKIQRIAKIAKKDRHRKLYKNFKF